jgi:hypothetical protein
LEYYLHGSTPSVFDLIRYALNALNECIMHLEL